MLFELPEFEYIEPSSLEEAVEVLRAYEGKAKILGGGTDLLGLMKDRISGPKMPIPSALVNIKKIPELKEIRHSSAESSVGSAVTLSEIASNETLGQRYAAFSQAAALVATNQIRNMGTLGGNLCQRPWCWYFRHPAFNCFKKGGKQCYAITGDHSTYFSAYNIGTCVMAHPSDTAPALISLDAKAIIASAKYGLKEVEMSKFFLGPKSVQDNILRPDELLIGVKIPHKPGTRSVYLKQRVRNNWDFALASVAASGSVSLDGSISAAKVVLGGVAPLPITIGVVSELLVGKNLTESTREHIREQIASAARPLRLTKYKVRMSRALVIRALDAVFG